MSGPATGRRRRATLLRVALPCLVLPIVISPLRAQTLTPDMLRPVREGFLVPQDSLLRKTSENTADPQADLDPDGRPRNKPAPSRIGDIPKYGLPAASGASESGFDSLNRTRKQPKFYPGQVKPKPPAGPGTRAPEGKGGANPIGRVRLTP